MIPAKPAWEKTDHWHCRRCAARQAALSCAEPRNELPAVLMPLRRWVLGEVYSRANRTEKAWLGMSHRGRAAAASSARKKAAMLVCRIGTTPGQRHGRKGQQEDVGTEGCDCDLAWR